MERTLLPCLPHGNQFTSLETAKVIRRDFARENSPG